MTSSVEGEARTDSSQMGSGGTGEGILLGAKQFANAGLAELEHGAELLLRKSRLFTRALHLDEFAPGVHHEIQVDLGSGIFNISQVQQRLAGKDAYADSGDRMDQRILRQLAFGDQLANGEGER